MVKNLISVGLLRPNPEGVPRVQGSLQGHRPLWPEPGEPDHDPACGRRSLSLRRPESAPPTKPQHGESLHQDSKALLQSINLSDSWTFNWTVVLACKLMFLELASHLNNRVWWSRGRSAELLTRALLQ